MVSSRQHQPGINKVLMLGELSTHGNLAAATDRAVRHPDAELAHRGNGERESGAFLLTPPATPRARARQRVIAVAYYDDLDPQCLTGGITFTAASSAVRVRAVHLVPPRRCCPADIPAMVLLSPPRAWARPCASSRQVSLARHSVPPGPSPLGTTMMSSGH